jgi:hypothetical protein
MSGGEAEGARAAGATCSSLPSRAQAQAAQAQAQAQAALLCGSASAARAAAPGPRHGPNPLLWGQQQGAFGGTPVGSI